MCATEKAGDGMRNRKISGTGATTAMLVISITSKQMRCERSRKVELVLLRDFSSGGTTANRLNFGCG